MQSSYSPIAGNHFPHYHSKFYPPDQIQVQTPDISVSFSAHNALNIPLQLPIHNLQNLHKYAPKLPIYFIIKQFFIFLFVFNKVINNSRQGFSIIKVALRQGYSSVPPTSWEFLSKYSVSATGKYEPIKLQIHFISQGPWSQVSYCHLISSKTALLLFMSSNNGENYKI